MKAIVLLETLLNREELDHDQIKQIFDTLPVSASVADFRNQLIKHKVLSFSQIMNIFLKDNIFPRSQKILKKIAQKKKDNILYKPKAHEQKFHVREGDRLVTNIAFAAGALPVEIPKPTIEDMKFQFSDEKQAIMLAIELAEVNEIHEAEVVLLETLETFKKSVAAVNVLCWIYLCTGHNKQSEHWSTYAIQRRFRDKLTWELHCLSEQLQNKHLSAAAHYQKLLRLNQIKSTWYLLLAYSQERLQCHREAAENYQIYARITRNDELKDFASQHMKELRNI